MKVKVDTSKPKIEMNLSQVWLFRKNMSSVDQP